MSKIKSRIKKTIIAASVTLFLSVLFVPSLRADIGNMSEIYLGYISNNTYNTLVAVNNIPGYLNILMTMIANWQQPDTSQATATIQGQFTSSTSAVISNLTTRVSLQRRVLGDLFGSNVTPATVPYANDMAYTTLLGSPYFQPDPRVDGSANVPDAAYNYFKNVAGVNITHVVPDNSWRGSSVNKQAYFNFYNTISAIQSYNAYVLSDAYVEAKNGYQPLGLQLSLMTQASSSDWFTTVSSETIGAVLRQILMYNSQMYVVLIQLLQTQKELLASQAMANTLMVVGNQFTETQLLAKATGRIPG